MTRSQATPASSQIITLERMLQERDDEIELLREAAQKVISCHDHTLPIMAAYMNSLGIKKEWEAQCSASDTLRAALGV